MEKITELFNKLGDLGQLVPELDKVTGWVQWLLSLAVRIGPVCILVLGLIHLLIPPKEANHKAGYRTYFGMGSVEAWMFTQRVSGAVMTLMGLILTVIAFIAVKKFSGMDLMAMGQKAFNLIKFQAVCALVIYVGMFLLTAIVFDRNGNRRFGGKKEAFVPAQIPEEEAQEISVPGQELPVEYEKQGEQVITADDIVIEGLD